MYFFQIGWSITLFLVIWLVIASFNGCNRGLSCQSFLNWHSSTPAILLTEKIHCFDLVSIHYHLFQQQLLAGTTTLVEWLKSTLLRKKECLAAHIFMKTECLQTKWIKTPFGVGKERIVLGLRSAWAAFYERLRKFVKVTKKCEQISTIIFNTV